MFTTINNLKIHYRSQGQGKPLLILHGWGRGSQSWQKFLDLAKSKVNKQQSASLQIIIPDLPGFGQSDYPPEDWSVGDYAEFVWQFLEKLNIKNFYLLGHSFGGRIAIKIAAELSLQTVQKYPPITKGRDRVGLKFVSSQTLPPPASPLQRGRKSIFRQSPQINHLFLCAAAGIKHPMTFRQKMVRLVAKLSHRFLSAETRNVAETQNFPSLLRKILYKLAGAGDYNRAQGLMKEVFKKVIAEDLTPLLSKIKIPTTIIWGDQDKLAPLSDGRLMREKTASSNLIILKGVGHNVQIEAGEELAGIIFNVR